MQTGALIVAAGKSSRMVDFKPMLQLGSISIAQRVINNFRQAGISKVVVVTGYHADVLECHLASNNVVFLRNENYANTHMFDSVRIGLEYLKDKVDTVLFTPVDVPLFTAQTVTQMLSLGRPLVTPVCNGNPGHPILIRSTLIDSILSDDGKSGLKGAVDNCGEPMYPCCASSAGGSCNCSFITPGGTCSRLDFRWQGNFDDSLSLCHHTLLCNCHFHGSAVQS